MSVLVFVVTQRPPRTTRTGTLFPYTTLFRSLGREPGRGTLSGKLARGLGKPLDAATPGWGVHAPARQLAEIEQALCDRAMGCSACHGIVDAQPQCPPPRTALRRRIARRPTAQFGQRQETIERCELRAAARKTSDLKAQGATTHGQRTTKTIDADGMTIAGERPKE